MDSGTQKARTSYDQARSELEKMREQTAKWQGERAKHAARVVELRDQRTRALMNDDEDQAAAQAASLEKEIRKHQGKVSDLDDMLESRLNEVSILAARLPDLLQALGTAWQQADAIELQEASAALAKLEPAYRAAVHRVMAVQNRLMVESSGYQVLIANIRTRANIAAWAIDHVMGRNGSTPDPAGNLPFVLRGTPEDTARRQPVDWTIVPTPTPQPQPEAQPAEPAGNDGWEPFDDPETGKPIQGIEILH